MDYKHLLDTTNFLFASIVDAAEDMGLSVDLIIAQVANGFEHDVRQLLLETDIDLEKIEDSKDIPDEIQHWADAIKSIELVHRCNIVEASDSKAIIDIGDCILNPACNIVEKHSEKGIPPCPWIAILYAGVEEKYGKQIHLESCKHETDSNSRVFELEFTE